MKPYEITNMIIDDGFDSLEYVTTDFTYNKKDYSITFNKSDLEVLNAWELNNNTSLPANLPNEIVDSIREDIKEKI